MKKKMKYVILSLLLFYTTGSAFAQDFASDFIQKHGDKDLEVVSIGKQMLSMLGGMSGDNNELKEALMGLESIKIISSDSNVKAEKKFNEAYSMLTKKSSGFSEMMSIKDDKETLFIMTREKDDVITDLVLLTAEELSFSLICLSGRINMEMLSKLASGTQLSGLKKLEAIQNN